MDQQYARKNKINNQPDLTSFQQNVRFFISLMVGVFLLRNHPLPNPLPKGEGASSLSLWGMSRVGVSLVCIVAVLLVLAGCQQETAASAAVMPMTEPILVPTATEEAVPTLPPAQTFAVAINTPPAEMPSFTLVDPADLEAAQDEEIVEETAVSTPNTPATTPEATFTPPALPFTSDEEHYWLQRPIPEGGTVWTDKIYPYGSTRGGTLRPHHGVEFYVNKGTPVIAAASGTVVVAGDDSTITYGPESPFYGNLVVIELDSTFEGQPVYNLYGHLSKIDVVEGQHVEAEQPIALSGASGIADGPHLHFEVRVGQNSYDSTTNPRLWLYPFPDYGTVAGRVVRANGTLVEGAPISLDRVDAKTRYLASTSYTGTTVNADPQFNENFVLDDVPMGYYEVRVAVGNKKYTEEIYVFPYRTNFVEIVIED